MTNQLYSKVILSGQDLENLGKWSYITLEEEGETKIIIIVTYRLDKVDINNIGTTTSLNQQ